MKIYITKYALSKGIIEIEGEIRETPHFKRGVSAYGKLSPSNTATGFYNNDFQLTKEEAITDSNNRVKRKIESLKKQIKKLETISFK